MKKYKVILSTMAISGDSKYFDFIYEAEDIKQVIDYIKPLSYGVKHIDIEYIGTYKTMKGNFVGHVFVKMG